MPSEAGERAGKCPHANYILITMDKSGLDLAGNDRTQTTKHKAAKGVWAFTCREVSRQPLITFPEMSYVPTTAQVNIFEPKENFSSFRV
jgi:hypothetical protein